MIEAIAKLKMGTEIVEATLQTGFPDWQCDVPILKEVINDIAKPSMFSPGAGHPIACAAEALRKIGAEVEVLVELEGVPGRVY